MVKTDSGISFDPRELLNRLRRLRRIGLAFFSTCLISLTVFGIGVTQISADDFFEQEIRPLLINHCADCHNIDNDSGGLVLTSRDAIMKGGDSGKAINLDAPEKSLLLQAVARQGDLAMPPDEPLSEQQIDSLKHWIKMGAEWPKTSLPIANKISETARTHWAFQPPTAKEVPTVHNRDWVHNPIDAFVLSKLEAHELVPAPEASQQSLLRRLSYTLTGLPPNQTGLRKYESEPIEANYDNIIDELLSSPHYGEHWGRHWLDVARYSDTKGYVYAREERFWPHAWAYRDWVVNALNEDMPYNRFLLLQLAADQVSDRRDTDLAAMGFLTLGRRFLGVNHLIVDDRIDVVTRGTMGMTVGCARCHDHKYDPIPTADYYSLYGIFNSSAETLVRLPDERLSISDDYEAELEKRQKTLNDKLQASRLETSKRARDRLRDYFHAQLELEKHPSQGFDQIFSKSDLLPEFVWVWERYLKLPERESDPVFLPWKLFADLKADDFITSAETVTKSLRQTDVHLNALVLDLFATPPTSFKDVIDRYAGLFEAIRDEADAEGFSGTFNDEEKEAIRKVLYESDSPFFVPDESIVHIGFYFDSGTLTELWKLQGEVDRWIIRSQDNVPFALAMEDKQRPENAQIFIRGNPQNTGRAVPRHFLTALGKGPQEPFHQGSGRFELAQEIASAENPLTARVLVNRVWTYHFGQGLVSTPSDFGLRAEAPSHPELLDWLTLWFIDHNWSLKELHRLILTSATYRQSSFLQDLDVHKQYSQIDPQNRLLWRMNAHRKSFEEFRDSLLAVSGTLDTKLGGKPAKLFDAPYPQRRTIYGLVDRQYLPGTLRVFDFANPDLHIPKRSETTVPQQALFFLNHPLVLEQIRELAARSAQQSTVAKQVDDLFQHVLQRAPTETEREEAIQFLTIENDHSTEKQRKTAADWSYGFGEYDAESSRTVNFEALPHFNGEAWQGGPKWPDSKLGWVQLTAKGGHPGNDRQHAAVRRWRAPTEMTISISSELIHEPAPGDGIRAFIVSSSQGLLASSEIHQSKSTPGVESLLVQAGETIDFIVDIKDVLNSDQYLWTATIRQSIADNQEHETVWNSHEDFTHDYVTPLSPLEQLAQLLICTNEFLFVD